MLQRIHHHVYTYISHYVSIHRESSCYVSLNYVRGNKARIDQLGLFFKYVAISLLKDFKFCTYAGLPSIHLKQCKGSGTMSSKVGPQCDTCWNLHKEKGSKSTTNYMKRWTYLPLVRFLPNKPLLRSSFSHCDQFR